MKVRGNFLMKNILELNFINRKVRWIGRLEGVVNPPTKIKIPITSPPHATFNQKDK